MKEWVSVRERMPEFRYNECGVLCTDRVLALYCAGDKTVHLGYCIKETVVHEDYNAVIDRWYNQRGERVEDVTHWLALAPFPRE